jgi:hypothetical protein
MLLATFCDIKMAPIDAYLYDFVMEKLSIYVGVDLRTHRPTLLQRLEYQARRPWNFISLAGK